MTTVEINRSGTDQASIDIFQTGSFESAVTLKHDLLDSKLNYHFAVTSLSVPLNKAPIFKLVAPVELFRIERRDVGESVFTDLTLHIPGNVGAVVPAGVRVFSITPTNKMYDVSSFVKLISNWARGFNQFWTTQGFNPNAGGYSGAGNELPDIADMEANGVYNLINVRLTADGTLQFVGDDIFWNNFVFRFTREGAARLGFYKQITAVVRQAGFAFGEDTTHYFIAKTLVGGVFTNTWLGDAAGVVGDILAGDMVQEALISSDHPLYQSVDQRIKCTVEWHGPSANNVAIIDENETIDRSIAEAYFESKLENMIRFDEKGVLENMTMQSAMYAGQTNFIRKSDANFQWNKLSTAYELKFFRFQVYIWYRVWNDATQRWQLSKDKLIVPDQQYWELSVRFVSDS
jgi:hypothetical protein